jgi:methionyl-tRNA synthetase
MKILMFDYSFYFFPLTDEELCAHNLKVLPLPLIHNRPSDLVLFEVSAILKFLLENQTISSRVEVACDNIVTYFERFGALKKGEEATLKLVNELNKNFSSSSSLMEQISIFATVKRIKIDNSLFSGEINSWISTFESNFGTLSLSVFIKNIFTLSEGGASESSSPAVHEEIIFKPEDGKVLPCEDGSKRNILITSALPYVNNVPHLGNIVGAVLSADVYARYCRRSGYRTLYICGTDEYGTATETKALEEGMSCKAICDKYFKMHASIYDWFQIDFDAFGRSSTPVQTGITHEIFKDLYDNGFFFAKSVDQCYCEGCSRFLADRYVEGTCPLCGFDDARGDQCDGCGKLLNAIELKSPQCKLCRNTPVIRSSNHLFLDLSKLQKECEGFVQNAAKTANWSSNSLAIARAWLTEGLRPRCMTRDLKWGTSVPMPGFEDKVFYVWFDAPIGYISITAGYDNENWRKWWQNPEKVELHQFMGKDNVPFHTVIFPSTLLGTRKPWTLLHQLNSTEYLNYEGGKFSKSRGTGVFGSDARDSGIPASIWRYYLLASRPESTDAAFSWSDFVAKTNSELLANLGNFVNRATRFVAAKFDSLVPAGELSEVDRLFMAEHVLPEISKYTESMELCNLRCALKSAMAISAAGNLYLAEQKLDNKLLQSNPSRCGTVINVALNLCYILSALLEPFIPGTSDDILNILRLPARKLPSPTSFELEIKAGHRIGQPFHLFTKLDESAVTELKAKFSGKSDGATKISVTESAAN